MNVIGRAVRIVSSKDPTKIGRSGKVLLESAMTLTIESDGRTMTIEKSGSAFELLDDRTLVIGEDIAGRLQDRLGRQPA